MTEQRTKEELADVDTSPHDRRPVEALAGDLEVMFYVHGDNLYLEAARRLRAQDGTGEPVGWQILDGASKSRGFSETEESARVSFKLNSYERDTSKWTIRAVAPVGAQDGERIEGNRLPLCGMVDFLLGQGSLEGKQFGDTGPEGGHFWWRSYLRKALAEAYPDLILHPEEPSDATD